MTWQKLAKSLSDAVEYMEFVRPDGQKDRIAMSCNTIIVSELGTFLNTEDDKLMSFLIRMWEGQLETFRHDTITSGNVAVENPWLNVIAATTPSWLKANFPEHMIGGGLTSRIVFVYGDKKRSLVPYPDEVIPSAEEARLRQALITDLADIGKLAGPYQLSGFARSWGRAWYSAHNDPDNRPPHLESDRFSGYLARKQTHLHKFAIILAAAKRSQLVIEEDDLREAEAIITDTERDMLKVFESIGAIDQHNHIKQLISIVSFAGMLTNKGLWARAMNYMTLKEFEEAVRAAVHGRMLEVAKVGLDAVVMLPKKAQMGPSGNHQPPQHPI